MKIFSLSPHFQCNKMCYDEHLESSICMLAKLQFDWILIYDLSFCIIHWCHSDKNFDLECFLAVNQIFMIINNNNNLLVLVCVCVFFVSKYIR